MINAEWKPNNKAFKTFDGIDSIVKEYAERAVEDMKRSMQSPKRGQMRDGHIASAPGESPAVYSTELINSLSVDKIKKSSYEVSADAEHAMYLEYGTHKIAPRPFFFKALEKNAKKMMQALANKIKRDL